MGSRRIEEGCERVWPGSEYVSIRFLARPLNAFSQASVVKLQIVTLAAKLFVLAVSDQTLGLLSQYVFSLARYDLNYDVRDRARMLTSLLSGLTPTPMLNGISQEERGGVTLRREQVRLVLFDGKESVADGTKQFGVYQPRSCVYFY